MATLQSLRGDYGYTGCSFFEFANVLEELMEQNAFTNLGTQQRCRDWLVRLQEYADRSDSAYPQSLHWLRENDLAEEMYAIGKRIADGDA